MATTKFFRLRHTLIACALAASQTALALPYAALAAGGAVRVAGAEVFSINTGGGGLSAPQRAQAIQRNLENALVAASDRSPAAVGVTYVKGTPVITLAGYYVATVDGASAKAAGVTPTVLANRWAANLKRALADRESVNSYLAHLSGEATAAVGQQAGGGSAVATTDATPPRYRQARLVYIPAGMVLPLKLKTAISTQVARAGDRIEAEVTEDVHLGDAYVPAGSTVFGHITLSEAGKRMGRSGVLGFEFNKLRTPDGAESPLQAHVIGGLGKYKEAGSDQSDTIKGESLETKLKQAAIGAGVGAAGGALIGTTIGAIAGRSGKAVGRGALSGLAIGAGVGVAERLLLRKGSDVVVASGEKIQLKLDAPVTLATSKYFTGQL